jgi:hypothetical protein
MAMDGELNTLHTALLQFSWQALSLVWRVRYHKRIYKRPAVVAMPIYSVWNCVRPVLFRSSLSRRQGDAERAFLTVDTDDFIPIATNSVGGIIVGLVTKHAGSVRKGFALIFGILLSGVVQAGLQPEQGITKEQIMGGVLAGVSLYLHATNPPSTAAKKAVKQD